MVQATAGQFARGNSDTFVYPRLPHVGDLLQIRVGTNGQGAFATWHLRQVTPWHASARSPGGLWPLCKILLFPSHCCCPARFLDVGPSEMAPQGASEACMHARMAPPRHAQACDACACVCVLSPACRWRWCTWRPARATCATATHGLTRSVGGRRCCPRTQRRAMCVAQRRVYDKGRVGHGTTQWSLRGGPGSSNALALFMHACSKDAVQTACASLTC